MGARARVRELLQVLYSQEMDDAALARMRNSLSDGRWDERCVWCVRGVFLVGFVLEEHGSILVEEYPS